MVFYGAIRQTQRRLTMASIIIIDNDPLITMSNMSEMEEKICGCACGITLKSKIQCRERQWATKGKKGRKAQKQAEVSLQQNQHQ